MQSIKQWTINGKDAFSVYIITLFDDGHLECTCKGYTYGGKHFCKHTQAKRSELEDMWGSLNIYLKQLKEYGK